MAIKSFDLAIQLDPNSPHALYGKAASEDMLHRPTSAIQNYHRFLKVAGPNDANLVANAQDRMARLGWRGNFR